MRLAFSSSAVSIKIGTVDDCRIVWASLKPLSPGIMTSRIKRSKLRPASMARASAALRAVLMR